MLLLGITYPPFSHLHAASLILPAVAESVLLRFFRYGELKLLCYPSV